ncbi:MAG: hypothetical protein ACRCV0_04060 [Brevinema sp.]
MNINRLLMMFLIFVSGNTFTQTLTLQYSKVSGNEIRFDVFYQGSSTELQIPARGRILNFTNQTDVTFGNNNIMIGSKKDTSTEYRIKFSYSFIIPNQGGFGSIGDNWFPTVVSDKEQAINIQYTVTSTEKEDMFIYPYQENINGKFTFFAEDKPKIGLIKFSHITDSSSSIPVSIFKSGGFATQLSDVAKMYTHFKEYFGDLKISEIVIINNQLTGNNAFVYQSKLYLFIPNIGNAKQVQSILTMAWDKQDKTESYLFAMFKDAVTRLNVLDLSPKNATETNTENIAQDSTTPTNEKTTSITRLQTDPSYVLPVPPVSYYQELLNSGFSNNTIIEVNVPDMLKNYGMLHMAWIHMGSQNFLDGVKAYFNQSASNNSLVTTNQENTVTEQERQNTNTTATSSTNSNQKEIDWNIIIQDKIQEPLFSLYTKEVLVKNPTYPSLKAEGDKISRNSYFIPSLSISDTDGNNYNIDWDNFLTTRIDITKGSYHLDPERRLPQENLLANYYTFNTNEQKIRRNVIFTAERNITPNEKNFKKHIEIIKLDVTANNAFEIPDNQSAYIVISHILSTHSGLLKDTLKETLITVDHANNDTIKIIAVRLRV